MQIIYQGKDITQYVIVRQCVARDTAGGRCDSLDIEFENAAGWYAWGPEEDDTILIAHDGYDTGTLYVNTVLPEDGRFRIFATALPCKARRKTYRSYTGKTIGEIMQSAAMASGMNYALYGVDAQTVIPYIEQENESAAAFLRRLLMLEGAALKCVNGKYVGIGIQYAQNREPNQGIELAAKRSGFDYRRNGAKLRSLTVRTPYASATATDTDVPSSHISTVTGEHPALNNIQAGRWAKGLLLDLNRQCESLKVESEYNIGFASMTRIDITGNTDATGEWVIETAEHDFINKTSTALMRRCIRAIS